MIRSILIDIYLGVDFMSFKDIILKSSYETEMDDLINDFYNPILSEAKRYDRIAGFFSSSSLAIAAQGIVGFLEGGEKMRLIVCPKLNSNDLEIIQIAEKNPQEYLDRYMINDLEDLEDFFEQQHVNALGWLLAKGILEIKVAFIYKEGKLCTDEGIFHQKIGIVYDEEGNIVSFSGSINESANGWLNNIEEFKVFRSWKSEQKEEYMIPDIEKFNDFWEGKRKYVEIYSVPDSVRRKLLIYGDSFQKEQLLVKNYKKNRVYKKVSMELGLFDYQNDAIEKWKNNGYKLLFQMATGTGKTRTAIGAMSCLMREVDKLIVIVSCPQNTLSLQWKSEIEKFSFEFDKSYIIDGTNPKWKSQIKEAVLNIDIGYYQKVLIYTTHETGSKPDFVESVSNSSSEILFIGDEAHGLGSFNRKKGLTEKYKYRIGLSATPSRWYDEIGTSLLEKYFGNDCYEFSIYDALSTVNKVTGKTFLVNYYYMLNFVDLSDEEIEEYRKLSADIIKLSKYKKQSEEYLDRFEQLLFKRADIVKNAKKKYDQLEKILDGINDIKDTIIFVSNEQLEKVEEILRLRSIPSHRLTQNEKTVPEARYGKLTERQHIISMFKKGYYKVLVAIKCLDEGIDIPSASCGILMASSTNPREYVQRIGRVIRQVEGKTEAYIYDISIKSCADRLDDKDVREFERKIIANEKRRLIEISSNAINNAEALSLIDENTEEE